MEILTDPANIRYSVKPIDPRFMKIWDLYKQQEASLWIAEEIDFSEDYEDFKTLTKPEQHFVEMVLAFFSGMDVIVNFNLEERFCREITVMEAKVGYDFQKMMENTHSQVYADMLQNIVRDPKRRIKLMEGFKEIPSIQAMTQWATKWIESDKSLGHRLIAFAIVEGVFFSGNFACIYWLKRQRSKGRRFMPGFTGSNEFIARDETMHVEFAVAMYSYIIKRVPYAEVVEIFEEANKIAGRFMTEAIQCEMIGMNCKLMLEYIHYVSDQLLVALGYKKLYHDKNPFDFMDTIGMIMKGNFFEKRPSSYQKACSGKMMAAGSNSDASDSSDDKFKILDDF